MIAFILIFLLILALSIFVGIKLSNKRNLKKLHSFFSDDIESSIDVSKDLRNRAEYEVAKKEQENQRLREKLDEDKQ